MDNADLKKLIRDVPNFPKEGILFKDITPLLLDPQGLASTVERLAAPYLETSITAVAGMESRGFLFGVPVAQVLGVGFIPIRKPGKLPADTITQTYSLEYGTDSLEMHADAVKSGDRILLVDDLLATGGTAKAAADLIRQLKGEVVGAAFAIELSFLNGRDKLLGVPVHTLISY
jgi:adenine phosphoribosyltransferase